MAEENNSLGRERRERMVRYAPLLIWIGVIFFLSSGQGSSTQTSKIIRPILEFFFPNATEALLIVYHGYIRKLAHFAEYFVLGLLAARAFADRVKDVSAWQYLAAFGLVILIASIDETSQSFNETRTGSPWDVGIDVSGGLAAILLFALWRSRGVSRETV